MKPKVLFVMHYPPPLNGGASLMGKQIKDSALVNENFEADFINLTTSSTLDKVGKGGIRKFLTVFQIIGQLLRALRSKKHDLCYMTLTATGSGFYKDFLMVLILKAFRRKILYHFHNKGVANAGRQPLNNLLYRFTFKNTRTILLTPSLYADIEKYVAASDIYYCPNGIPAKPGNVHRMNTHVGAPAGPCVLLFLSNMMKEKGVFVLLEALRILQKQQLSFVCHMVGDWVDISEQEFTEHLETSNLKKQVFAHGAKYGEEKFRYLESAQVFVFPTYFHNETFGLVNLEAMQAGLPIVSTLEGGIPDVIQHGVTGFLVPQKDAKALAEKLALLIQNPLLRVTMGNAGKARYEELFTAEAFERKFVSILRSEVSGKKFVDFDNGPVEATLETESALIDDTESKVIPFKRL